MRIGLPQGFVRFGTYHHRILVAMLQLGPLRHRDVVEDLGLSPGAASVALAQLADARMIHRQPPARAYDTGERTQAVWGLDRYRGPLSVRTVRASAAERQARYRTARRQRVASVWEFRPAPNAPQQQDKRRAA